MIEFADTLYKDGAWSEAKNYYTKALDKANNLVQIRLKRAKCSYNTGAFNDVVDDTMYYIIFSYFIIVI